ncbi:hypothetical protein [Clostridium sp. BJN0013]
MFYVYSKVGVFKEAHTSNDTGFILCLNINTIFTNEAVDTKAQSQLK